MAYAPKLAPPLSLVALRTVGSTNDHARNLARNGHPAGVVVWAHEQTAGRGRQGNGWVSNAGNLFMTIILRPQVNAAQIGQLSLLAGVALANVLADIVPPEHDIRLKWPNDLFIGGKKAAGILVETESQGALQVPWVVVGIGVNIKHAPENAASLADAGVEAEAGQVLEGLAAEIMKLAAAWEKDGFAAIRAAWLKRAYKLGETITARLPRETLTGIFEDLDATGALLLADAAGKRHVINTGEVFA
ncbi:MAG: biotin--[acetyl-CoA-carboxylase] ligase [Alphaproteobacteria bacterium]|nr:biotin--[acetyl-CoA-carboxylase] ligase [Alphaproteobacteria bacterium]MDE2336462.1 biotin--[acetyl-CoA-carboxylase] ligase [Alphaproteobacteria bacterium]